jgi:hypothetical protein
VTIAIRGTTTATVDSSSPYTVAKPTGTTTGDFMLASVVCTSGTIDQILPPAGWYAVLGGGVNGSNNIAAWYKVAGASEPSTYDFTSGTNTSVGIGIITFYSDSAAQINVDAVATQVNASSTNRTYPSVTFSAAGMMVCFGAAGNSLASTPPGSMTELWDTTVSGNKTYCMYGSVSVAGASGTRTATGTAQDTKCISIALVEATTTYAGIRYRTNTNTGPTVSASSIALTMASTIESGDMLIAQLVLADNRTVTTPDGWTLEANLATTGAMRVYSKVAIDDDAGATLTVNFTGGSTTASLAVSVFWSPDGDQLQTGQVATDSTGAAASITFPSVTSTDAGSVLVMLTSKAQTTGYQLTNNLDMWERYDYGGTAIWASMFSEYLLAVGATGTRSAVPTSGSHAADMVSLLIEIYIPPPTYRIYPSERYTSVVYNGTDITQYCRLGDLEGVTTPLDATSLADSFQTFVPGTTSWVVTIEGNLTKEIDDMLGKEALSPPSTMRDLVITVGEATNSSTYTWTGDDEVGAFITNYKVGPNVQFGQIPFRAEIATSGAPVRSTT